MADSLGAQASTQPSSPEDELPKSKQADGICVLQSQGKANGSVHDNVLQKSEDLQGKGLL